MCGRYYVDDGTEKKVQELTHDSSVKLRIGDVLPSETATILDTKDNRLTAEDMIWGFPNFERGALLINARAETVTEKRSFKECVLSRRCVIPAKGFYEWSADKERYNFEDPGKILFLAGCYDTEKRFVIITTAANESVSPVHPRMPLLLTEDEIEKWLNDMADMTAILQQTPGQLQRWVENKQMSMFDPPEINEE